MEKKTYTFSVTEVNYGVIQVLANSEEEAKQMIDNGEYCMDVNESEFTDVQLMFINE